MRPLDLPEVLAGARPAGESGGRVWAEVCALCAQERAEAECANPRNRYASGSDDDEEVLPDEQFPNQILDALTTRMRATSQGVQGLLNLVLGIFDKGQRPAARCRP